MKYLTLILCIFGFLFQPKVKVIESEAYKWAGGRAESGMGINYTFKIVAGKSSDILTIDELWIDTNYFKVKPQKQLDDLSISNEFDKKDTVIIQVNHMLIKGKYSPENNTEQIAAPIDFEGDALIGYKIKGKQKYLEVEKIKFSETRNYQ